MNFSAGNSNAKTYTGFDQAPVPEPARPAFAVSGCNYDQAVGGTGHPNTVTGSSQIGLLNNGSISGTPSMTVEPVDSPSFLQSADAARQYLNSLQATAQSLGRYFKPASGSARTVNTSNGGTTTSPLFTFVDGDCDLDGGNGMLVVTGRLNMSGNPSFNGIILVLGEGNVNRNGGGNGTINGAIVVAKFARTWPASENNQPHPFLAPTFNTNGGGNSDVQYDSDAIAKALGTLGSSVAGILEY